MKKSQTIVASLQTIEEFSARALKTTVHMEAMAVVSLCKKELRQAPLRIKLKSRRSKAGVCVGHGYVQ